MNEILDKLDKSLGEKVSALDQAIAKMHEPIKPDPSTVKILPPETEAKKAEMAREGVLGGITGMQVWSVPVGQALVGGFAAVFVTELIDGFMIKQGNVAKGITKLVIAGIGAKWGKRLLGDTGAKTVTLLIAYDAIRELLPYDLWIQEKVAPKITGAFPTRGLAQGRGNAVNQAEMVASNYSRSIFGR